MGREVRFVPKDWRHPINEYGRYKPLHPRRILAYHEPGEPEIPEDELMPDFGNDATHFQMYEDCSEGTPISPICETPEELAQWLADNEASAFAGMTATYEQWLSTIRKGSAPSGIIDSTGLHSGVEYSEKD